MTLDVLCPKYGGVAKAIAPMFVMPNHGLLSADCEGNGMLGTPINLIHVPTAPPRVIVGS
jgi:hypothetical protein